MNKHVITAALVGFLLVGVFGVYSTLTRGTDASTNPYRILTLLNFELLNPSPIGKDVPGSNPDRQIYDIQFQSSLGTIQGQSILDTSTSPPTYTLDVQGAMNMDPDQGKRFILWLASPNGTESFALAESPRRSLDVNDWTNNRDLASYVLIVTQEDATDQQPQPSEPIIQASQQLLQAPQQQPPPDTGGDGGDGSGDDGSGDDGDRSSPTATETPDDDSEQGEPSPTEPDQPDINAEIQRAIDGISESTLQTYIENLVSNEQNTRYTGTQGNITEANYIKSEFDRMGIESELQTFTHEGTQTRNIIGRITGNDPSKWYLVTAHMDSISGSSAQGGPAPGADDNASGTAAVLAIADSLASQNIELDASVEFVLFSAEEQHLIGSQFYVQENDKNIVGVINVDMIGNKDDQGDCVNFVYKSGTGGNIYTDEVVTINNQFNIGLQTSSSNEYNPRSDHDSFNRVGIPGVFGHECTFSDVYHSEQDTQEHLSYSQIHKTTQAVAGTLVKLSNTGMGQGIAEYGYKPQFFSDSLQHRTNRDRITQEQVLGVNESAPILAVVYFESLNDIDTLYDAAAFDIDYFTGDNFPRPVFIGLFASNELDALEGQGYEVEIVDEQADIEQYIILFHPEPGQESLLQQYGSVFTLAPQYYLVKFPEGEEFSHQGELVQFFDVPIQIEQSRPPFRTDRITPRPTQTAATTQSSPGAGTIIPLLFFGVFVIVAGGVVVYVIQKNNGPQSGGSGRYEKN